MGSASAEETGAGITGRKQSLDFLPQVVIGGTTALQESSPLLRRQLLGSIEEFLDLCQRSGVIIARPAHLVS